MSRRDQSGSHLGTSATKEAESNNAHKSKQGSQLGVPKPARSSSAQRSRPEGAAENGDGKRSSRKAKKEGSRVSKHSTVAGSDHKEHAHGEHEPRLHTSQAHKDGHPPAPPTARDPAAVEPKASPASRKSSSHKHGSHHTRHSHKDKRHSVRTPKRADDAPAAPTAAPAAAPAPLPERSVAASPSPVAAAAAAAAPASAPALSSVAPPSSGRRQIADASPPVSVFVVSECSLYALRLYLYLAEKGRNYIEAPVPEPEWLRKHTNELVGVAFADSAATASLPSMRLIEKAYPEPALFPATPESEELITFLDQELTTGVNNLLFVPASVPVWRPRLLAAFQRLDALLTASTSDFLLPTGFSVLDVLAAVCISALPQLSYFRAFELPALPRLDKYRTVLFSRPALSRNNYTTDEWRAALRKAIPRAPLPSHNMCQHQAIRVVFAKLADFVAAQKGQWTAETLAQLEARWYRFTVMLEAHTRYEEEILFPAMEALSPGCVRSSETDGLSHEALGALAKSLAARIRALVLAPPPSPVMSPGPAVERLLPDMLAFKDANLRHMLGEEKQLAPVVTAEAQKNPGRVRALMERVIRSQTPAETWLLLGLTLGALDMPSAEQYLWNYKQILSKSELYTALAIAERTLPEATWLALQQRCDFLPAPFAVPAFRPLRAAPRVLVLGVHTAVGEALLRLLLQHTPFAVRVALHEAATPPELSGLPAHDVQIARVDLRDPAALAAVFWGVERLFLSLSARSRAHMPRIAAAAAAARVKHVVAVDTQHSPELAAWSLPCTVFHADSLFSSLTTALPAARRDGRLRLPLAPTARLAPLSEADVAEVVMHALAAPPPEQSVAHNIAGHILSPADVASCFEHYLGRRVRVDADTEEAWAAESAETHGEADTEALLALWRRASRCTEKDTAKLVEGMHTARTLLDRDPTNLSRHLAALGTM